jgi:hypothetical protein
MLTPLYHIYSQSLGFDWCHHFSCVQECLTFTHEEYADMHFMFRFCNENGRAAVAEYKQCHIEPSFAMYTEYWERGMTSFPWGNAEREQQLCDREDNVLCAFRWCPHTNVCRTSMRLVSHNHRCGGLLMKCKNLYQEIMPTMYSFVDCCKDNHNLQITFYL